MTATVQPATLRQLSLTPLLTIIFVVSGLLLIAVSLLLPEKGLWLLAGKLLKELGVVLLAVFTVSLLYELSLAKKYREHFESVLRSQFQQGESNAAVCALLGIQQIYPSRAVFDTEHSLEKLTEHLGHQGRLRVMGRSLFQLMNKHDTLQGVIGRGTSIELCLLDPTLPKHEVTASFLDTEISDIQSALSTFTRLVDWIVAVKPTGRLKVGFHRMLHVDSYLQVSSPLNPRIVWDLSFGRANSHKRIVLVDPSKSFGVDLSQRYDRVFGGADTVFEYDGRSIVTNKLAVAIADTGTLHTG